MVPNIEELVCLSGLGCVSGLMFIIFYPLIGKGETGKQQGLDLQPFVFICESCFGRKWGKPVEYLVVSKKKNKDGQKDVQ